MSPEPGLAAWLGRLSEPELVELLRLRPDALLAPQPRTLAELADRLDTPHSATEALRSLDVGALRLVETACALADDGAAGADRRRLHELLGGREAVEESRLTSELAGLSRRALVWEHRGRLHVADQVRAMLPNPLGLGRPARELLEPLTVEQLKLIGARLGLAKLPRKAVWVEQIAAELADPEAVRRRLAAAAPALRAAVEELAREGPLIEGVHLPTAYQRAPAASLGVQLALQGWALPAAAWGQIAEMPREVALAVRGEEDTPALPEPPPVPFGAALDPGRLSAAAQAAASATLDGTGRLLTLLGDEPLARLRSGGIGIRELRRAAKQLRARENQVRLWLECAAAAGLLRFTDDGLLPTEAADSWLDADPASALAVLARAWWRLPGTPTHRVDDDEKILPALGAPGVGPDVPALRALLFETLAASPPGTPVASLDPLIDLLAWRRPLRFGDGGVLGPYAVAGLAEARELGLVADQALTPLGRAVHEHAGTDPAEPAGPAGPDALAVALAGLLPAPTTTATFLPDLTAVVAGAPAAGLCALLDSCADNESRDAASTWRFGPASIRRALDAGRTADRLLGELAAVADRELPQPLTYLVGDVARRHGQLRVRPVACCVCVTDPALAREVAGHRALAALRLTPLSETVLSSAKPVAETLAALRAAGYAPTREDAGGQAVIERVAARRAPVPRRGAHPRPGRAPRLDPVALARRLRTSGAAPAARSTLLDGAAPASAGLLEVLGSGADQLTPGEVAILADSIDSGRPVHIDYLSASGGLTGRVVEPTGIVGHLLVAWCRLRDDERNFALGRIAGVHPVAG